MRGKKIGWFVGSLGLLLGAGAAWGNEQTATSSGTEAAPAAAKPECRDAGVTVAFKTGSAELDLNARGGLDGVATWMKAKEGRTLHLEGVADTTGDSGANLVLSARRAEAVKTYLIEKGVDSTAVLTVGRGEEIDHLPANGRAVTFLACQPGATVATEEKAETKMDEAEGVAPMPEPSPVVVAPVTVIPPPAPVTQPHWKSGFGWAFMAGGAYQDFTNDSMRSTTDPGGGWAARFIGGTNSVIGFEAAYIGAANQVQTLNSAFSGSTPLLVANGLEGTARLNIPIRRGASLFEPYGYAGLGYSHYTISNYNQNTNVLSSFTSSDDVMNFPVGGGFAYAYKALIMDARAGWTGTYYQNILPGQSETGTLDHWNVGGQIGFMF
jgi:peptidoglycan-associated lipoprotein